MTSAHYITLDEEGEKLWKKIPKGERSKFVQLILQEKFKGKDMQDTFKLREEL